MLKLRKYVKSDAETIVRWIADERSCYLWSADRYGHYPVSPQDMNASERRWGRTTSTA